MPGYLMMKLDKTVAAEWKKEINLETRVNGFRQKTVQQ